MGQRVISTQERLGKAGETGDNGVGMASGSGSRWDMRAAKGPHSHASQRKLQGETELPAMERGNKSNESKVVARQKYMSFCLRRTGENKK